MRLILDTNAVIHLINGRLTAPLLPQGSWGISVVSEIELLGARRATTAELVLLAQTIALVSSLPLNDTVKHCAIDVRRHSGLKAADAIIAATAISLGLPLVSNDRQMASVPGLALIIPELR